MLLAGYQNESTFVGGISEGRPISEPFVFIGLLRIRGPASIWEVEKRRAVSCRELPEDQVLVSYYCVTYQVPGGGREMEGGGPIGKGWTAGGTGRLGFLF